MAIEPQLYPTNWSNIIDSTNSIINQNNQNDNFTIRKQQFRLTKLSSIYDYIVYRIHRRYRRNPFRCLIKWMILLNLLPLNEFEQITNRKFVDNKRKKYVIIFNVIPGILNLFRLFSSLKSYDELNDNNDHQLNWHTCIFAPLFIYGENRYQFNLALFSSFFCEFLLFYLSWKIVLNPKKRYNLFIQIKQWDQIFQQTFGDNSFKPNQSALIKKSRKLQSTIQYSSINNRKQLRKLCCWLDFYVRAVPIFGCIMMIFFLNMIGLDFLIGYNNYQLSLLFWFSFIFFNIILLFSTFRVLNFSLSWLFILLISALLYHYQYEHVRTRMLLMKSSTKHEYRIKLLCQLNEINGKIMRFAHEIATFVLIFYYVYVIINDMELVLLLDLRSEEFIRYALAVVFFATFTFAVIGFTVFAQLNVYSRRLIPQIERLIYCQNDHQQHQQSTVMSIYDRIISNRQQILQHQQHCQYLPIRLILFRLKLLETHLQLTTNMIGIRCGDIFTITSADNFRSLIFFFINVILISNLFQSHF